MSDSGRRNKKHRTGADYAEAISQCQTLREFRERHRNAYQALLRDREEFERLTAGLERRRYKRDRQLKGAWTEAAVRSSANGFQTKAGFRRTLPAAYAAAVRFGILGGLFAERQPMSLRGAVGDALQDGGLKEFRKKHPGAYKFLAQRQPALWVVRYALESLDPGWDAERIVSAIEDETRLPGSCIDAMRQAALRGRLLRSVARKEERDRQKKEAEARERQDWGEWQARLWGQHHEKQRQEDVEAGISAEQRAAMEAEAKAAEAEVRRKRRLWSDPEAQ